MRPRLVFLSAVLPVLLAACEGAKSADENVALGDENALTGLEHAQTLADGESAIVILGTNDVHGSLDRFPQLGGYVDAARAHLTASYPNRGTLLLLDAGDATQGTLLSNYSEGQVAVRAMSKMGYTAAIAGNHGFDFGPSGWKKDQCLTSDPAASCDPLDALHRSVSSATFPFLGANVKRRSDAKHLDFLPPSMIVQHQGRGIAVIGLENHFTDRTTVPENVAALTFGDGREDLQTEVEALYQANKADVFILVMHEGDADTASMRGFLESLPKRANGEPLVDAAIAGHSHTVNDSIAAGIPYIQSGANGEMFGSIELITKKDPATGRLFVERERTRKKAAIPIADRPTGFLGQRVTVRDDIGQIVRGAHDEVRPIAEERLTTTATAISRDGGRTSDSPMGNVIADAMRRATRADVALINGGDVRDDIKAGDILYEELFQVLPKNLSLVTVKDMPTERLVEQVRLAVKSCGRRGALQISGMTLVFRRDCDHAFDGEDSNAVLVSILVSDASGAQTPIFQRGADGSDVFVRPTVNVATTDFVMSGGAGYNRFVGLSATGPILVLRDEIAADMKRTGVTAQGFARGRYVDCTATPTDARCH